MNKSYHGNTKPYAFLLYHAADETAVLPVCEQLSGRGLRLCYGGDARKSRIKRACALLAFASASSVLDDAFEDAILTAKAHNVPVVCVDLDGTPLPDSLQQLLFSSNTVAASRYPAAAGLAARIMTAESLNPPKLTRPQIGASRRFALALIAAAVIVVAAVAIVLVQRSNTAPVPVVAEVAEEPGIDALPDVAGLVASGMTEEELLAVRELYLVGDTRVDFTQGREKDSDWHNVILDVDDGSGTVWIVDEERIARGTITDISLIGRMANLETLVLCNQSLTDLTPLGELTKLRHLEIFDTPVTDLSALGRIASLEQLDLYDTAVTDLSPLNACDRLTRFTCGNLSVSDLDGLGHASMRELEINSGTDTLTDFSALAACTGLEKLFWESLQNLEDITALAACTQLQSLEIRYCDKLRDLSALSTLDSLTELQLDHIPVNDISCFRNCRGLQTIGLQDVPVRDMSWIAGMNSLRSLMLHCELSDLNFLKDLDVQKMELHFSGPITDYSGLAAIPAYTYIHVNPFHGNAGAVLPYLQDAQIESLCLHDCRGLDLSMLPQVNSIEIYYSDLRDLAGLDKQQHLQTLQLRYMSYLTSLAGLPTNGQLRDLTITDCLRLTDMAPMYGQTLSALRLTGLLVTPDLSQQQFRTGDACELYLDNVAGITDLSFLPDVKGVTKLDVRAMDGLNDLSPIERSGIKHAVLPPQVAEQAAALVDEGVLYGYEIAYPEGESWEDSIREFSLLSLDELDTLPDVLLSHVTDLCLVGDRLYKPDEEHWQYDWGSKKLLIGKNDSEDAPVAVGKGSVDSLDRFQTLTGLNRLELIGQPLTSLSGIETFANLRRLNLSHCTAVADVSNAFTLTELEELQLSNTAVTSLQGVQNLSKLLQLDLNDTGVTDLSPLRECDFSYANENGGLFLTYNNRDCEDFSALESIPRFQFLAIGNLNAEKWLSYIAGKPIRTLHVYGSQLTDAQIAFIATLPELEELSITWNEQVSDLTPLLSSSTLTTLTVSNNMQNALKSIEGKASFEIRIEG